MKYDGNDQAIHRYSMGLKNQPQSHTGKWCGHQK